MFDDIDTDEPPFVLVWELTQACKLACKHCRAEAEPTRHPDELTTAEGRGLLEEAREFGPRQLVVLSGGALLASVPPCALVPEGYDGPLPDTCGRTGSGTGSPG